MSRLGVLGVEAHKRDGGTGLPRPRSPQVHGRSLGLLAVLSLNTTRPGVALVPGPGSHMPWASPGAPDSPAPRGPPSRTPIHSACLHTSRRPTRRSSGRKRQKRPERGTTCSMVTSSPSTMTRSTSKRTSRWRPAKSSASKPSRMAAPPSRCGGEERDAPPGRSRGGERGAGGRGEAGAEEGEDAASRLGGAAAQEDVRLRRVRLREVWRKAAGAGVRDSGRRFFRSTIYGNVTPSRVTPSAPPCSPHSLSV